jgi:hypothetical protein
MRNAVITHTSTNILKIDPKFSIKFLARTSINYPLYMSILSAITTKLRIIFFEKKNIQLENKKFSPIQLFYQLLHCLGGVKI